MEIKLFDKEPHSHDENFYKNREVADHWSDDWHKPRLMQVMAIVNELIKDYGIKNVADFGCGASGLLAELVKDNPDVKFWGYDLQPKNVVFARENRNLDVMLGDFTGLTDAYYQDYKDITFKKEDIKYPELLILTETLEHLPDPSGFLKSIRNKGIKFIVASSPWFETEREHDPSHLWIWKDDGMPNVFLKAGWNIVSHTNDNKFQYIIAK